MASQVLSGATNASYTNNTGQNVRLIINYMSNVTSMTWAGVTVTASATTIGKDIQNITGELRQAVKGTLTSTANQTAGPNAGRIGSQVWNAELDPKKAKLVEYSSVGEGSFLPSSSGTIAGWPLTTGGSSNLFSIRSLRTDTGEEQDYYFTNLFYVPLTVSRGGNFPVELMLANGQSFSSVCGAFNAIVIKEDGT